MSARARWGRAPAVSAAGIQRAVTPCQVDPETWDLSTCTDGAVVARRAELAVAGCRACPRLDACARDAAERPPGHECVQGGLVYYRGLVYRLNRFRRLVDTTAKRPYRAGRSGPAEYEQTLRDLVAGGLSDEQIGAELRMAARSVARARRRLGLHRRGGPKLHAHASSITDPRHDAAA